VEGFTRNTFTAMVEGVEKEAIALGFIDGNTWRTGIRDLYRTAKPGGTFCYTFFKATGRKAGTDKHHTAKRQLWGDQQEHACDQPGL
jgi:hypothetical protein